MLLCGGQRRKTEASVFQQRGLCLQEKGQRTDEIASDCEAAVEASLAATPFITMVDCFKGRGNDEDE
ncbi:hypothetical protein MHYP_G00333310 [Metynnis hypsauchen]